MEDDDFKPITKVHIFSAILVILFGWGILWVATHSSLIAENVSSTFVSEQNGRHVTAAVVGNATSSSSPTPYTSSSPSASWRTSQSPSPSPSATVSSSPQPVSTQITTPSVSSTYAPNSSPSPVASISPVNRYAPTPSVSPRAYSSPSPSTVPTLTPKTQSSPSVATPTKTSNSVHSPATNSTTGTTLKPSPVVKTSNSAATSSLTIMIGGDIMMDRTIRKVAEKNGYDSLFTGIAPLFKQADIVTVNLEGPITSNRSITLLPDGRTAKDLVFTFNPKSAEALANAGITLVDLANNHSYNFGSEGIAETKKWLSKSKIQWFGDYRNSSSTEALVTKNNIKVAFVGYHAFQPGFDRVLGNVNKLFGEGNFVIVTPHWGIEYATTSTSQMRSQARLLVAAGAGAIIGSHPHVVLEHLTMGNVPVFFSIGNLLFDQYFSPEVMKGNVVELHLSKVADTTNIDRIRIYETSTASRTGVTVDMTPMDF